jgi:hypothetical protein
VGADPASPLTLISSNTNPSTPTIELVGGPGTYEFTLTVTDSAGTTANGTATVIKQ